MKLKLTERGSRHEGLPGFLYRGKCCFPALGPANSARVFVSEDAQVRIGARDRMRDVRSRFVATVVAEAIGVADDERIAIVEGHWVFPKPARLVDCAGGCVSSSR